MANELYIHRYLCEFSNDDCDVNDFRATCVSTGVLEFFTSEFSAVNTSNYFILIFQQHNKHKFPAVITAVIL